MGKNIGNVASAFIFSRVPFGVLENVIRAGGFGQNLDLSHPRRLTKVSIDQPDRFQYVRLVTYLQV